MSSMAAISGLLINNDYIDIISNNIANASTIGYKSRKPIFFDMFSHSFYSNNTNGYGVRISNVTPNFNNGMLVETGRGLDLGIIEDGFFRVLDSQGHVHYTRDGQFLLDKNNNIINMQGLRLTGQNKFSLNNTCNNPGDLEPINLNDAHILKEKNTSTITLKAILNRNTHVMENIDSSGNDISGTKDYTTTISIYNKDGQKEKINISFNKIEKDTWKVNVTSNESGDQKSINNSFNLKFDSDGELTSDKKFTIESKNSKKYDNITLDLTGTIEQSDADNSLEEYTQNGYSQGILKTFNVFPNGDIIGIYSNKQQEKIGQILLSKFVNPEKLQPESGNLWSANSESGSEIILKTNDKDVAILSEKTLEASNVDLNKELINMIIAQRNYQSNAQSFKTEDKIINTLINLR